MSTTVLLAGSTARDSFKLFLRLGSFYVWRAKRAKEGHADDEEFDGIAQRSGLRDDHDKLDVIEDVLKI